MATPKRMVPPMVIATDSGQGKLAMEKIMK